MRTTVNIDDDVLQAARELAHRERKTVGEVLSELARKTLTTPRWPSSSDQPSIHGLRPFPKRGGIVTNEVIDRLREDDVY